MPWYAIRTVYHFGVKDDGKNVFEERVVCFNAADWAEAHEKADQECTTYAEQHNFIAHPEQSGYQLDEALIDGYELWSELFESEHELEEFYAERYGKYEYHVD